MKKARIHTILSSLFLCAVLLTCCAHAADAPPPTKEQRYAVAGVYAKGTLLNRYLNEHKGMGYVYIDSNGRTMAPLRALSDALGMDVAWNSASERATVTGGVNGAVVFSVGSTSYTVGGQIKQMDTMPVMIEGRMHLPVRFMAESVGADVYVQSNKVFDPGLYVEIYYHADDVTPEPPSWADGDYVTFDRTNAYSPENWAKITDLRRRVAAGEDIKADMEAFYSPFLQHDRGVYYELLLIRTMYNYQRNQSGNKSITLNAPYIDAATEEQESSLTRWELRDGYTLVGEHTADYLRKALYKVFYPSYNPVRYGGHADRYDPDTMAVLGKSTREFLAEKWFSGLEIEPVELIYFDRYCFSPATSGKLVYRSGGVPMVDLEVIGASLSLKRGWQDTAKTANELKWKEEQHDDKGVSSIVIEDWFGKEIRVTRGSADILSGGKRITLEKPVELYGGHLFVPIGFLDKVLGETVTYDEKHGIFFVNRNHQVSDERLVRWALGMSALLSSSDGQDPYYFGMNTRCMIMQENSGVSPYDPNWIVTSYSYYPTYYMSYRQLADQWGCFSADDIRNQAALLVANAETTDYPAWHLFRVAHIASLGYSWGYLTGEEAAQLVKPAAEALKRHYHNWDEATEDYLTGYVKVFGGSEAVAEQRRQLYQQLKAEQSKYGLLFDDTLFQS